ncbi:putative oxygen-independent coproporphyrinogen III oxidase [Longilinea arvoryzae]|uniref:Heme chaperone HemW n=1 Tax=Longilinea arvoryzae TaxID=360412 RepID=A0A0S7BH44_9CHLR|nr:radical SAM family heme chaperone HemW [Longilinea arvoryzae]GAP14464.1 putative oxygen-independent coproporphyrinogen III oxidase [Longilinea arvoryzae]
MLTHMQPTSLYLHIPFCRHRCAYCDFNTYAGLESRIPAYVDALCREIRWMGASSVENLHLSAPIRVHTLFFGGGTPSLLTPQHMEAILGACRESFAVDSGAEISMEANPGTVTLEGLRALRSLGVNRLSYGMQSAHPDDLSLLQRQHDTYDVIEAVNWARQAGFDLLSLDLIFGLPFQSLERWQNTLETAIDLQTDHLSLYALTIEHGTPFQSWLRRGLVPLPDDDLAADMYDYASERLEQAGFQQYEISNWAKVKDGELAACRHNLQYWHNQPYLGLGAGAHGYHSGYRLVNAAAIPAYIERCQTMPREAFPVGPATIQAAPIDRWTEVQETMMVGLRLTGEGVPAAEFHRRFGVSLEELFGADIDDLIEKGLLEWDGGKERLRLSKRGRLLGNRVFRQFVGREKPKDWRD